jgi:transposase InsO family protein
MDDDLKEIIHCLKCKKRTKNIDAIKVQTNNDRWRISAKCIECNTNKSKFIQLPKDVENNKIKQIIKEKDKLPIAQELHKSIRKQFPKRKVFTKGIDDLWAADLVIMKNYEKENDNYFYMLNVIDTFSKFAWSYPLKKKDGKCVSTAFEKIIEKAKVQNHKPPALLHTDKGLEFENKLFKEILKKYEIKIYHTQNEEKSSIIERFNRTLNGKMRIRFEVQKNKKWIHILQSLLDEYNFKDTHRTIGMRPCEVNKCNESEILRRVFSENKSK